MKMTENSSGGVHVTVKRSEAAQVIPRLPIPLTAVVLRETKTYYDAASRKQFVVTTEADEFDQGQFNGRRL